MAAAGGQARFQSAEIWVPRRLDLLMRKGDSGTVMELSSFKLKLLTAA